MTREHTRCLNCGETAGAHDPDDPDGCGEWWPSTLPRDVHVGGGAHSTGDGCTAEDDFGGDAA